MGKPRAAAQGGILQGANPSVWDPKNPIIVFIIQAGIIIIFTRILHFPLSKIKQPRVIAEIIGGILLGPSVMGRIPGFTAAIFPAPSMPVLSTAANVGLILFLFLVGLEVDLRIMLRNWKIALSVGAAGMALPFGLGCAIAWGLYHQFRTDSGLKPIAFGTYMLFVGVAMAITAFPVLCRILTELKLLQTQVGVVVLAAGVSNDVIGWVLLALCVALVNAGSGIVALYVLLTCVAWVLFLVFAVRPLYIMLLKRTDSINNGPSQSIVGLTILMVFASAFFTGIIGVHPIFGAFLMGLICPHERGFAIRVAEKIEDLVAVFFLPLYFALSGLSTNLGLLNTGITWAYVIGVIAVAFVAKVTGGTLAARANKLVWRESFTIGVLMSCKGLVELIVLNIGLQAKILSQRTFTIFVVMALVTTFATTPLTLALFPPWYQKKLAAWKRGEIDWDGNRLLDEDDPSGEGFTLEKDSSNEIHRLLLCLRLDSLPSLFTFVALLGGIKSAATPKVHPTRKGKPSNNDLDPISVERKRPLEVHGLRMLELSERLSSVMQDAEHDEFSTKDPVVNAFHTFGQLSNVAVSGDVELVPEGSYPEVLSERATQQRSDMILLPWSESGNLSETLAASMKDMAPDAFRNGNYNHYVSKVMDSAPCNAAVLVNKGFGALPREENRLPLSRVPTDPSRSTFTLATAPLINRDHHIFLPFVGGADDRVALRFVLRLAKDPNVTATIMHLRVSRSLTEVTQEVQIPKSSNKGNATVTSSAASTPNGDQVFFTAMADSLPNELQDRVVFDTMESSNPRTDALATARAEMDLSPKNAGDLIVVGRNHSRDTGSTTGLVGGEGHSIEHSLGALAGTMVRSNMKASVLVIQARKKDI